MIAAAVAAASAWVSAVAVTAFLPRLTQVWNCVTKMVGMSSRVRRKLFTFLVHHLSG